MKVEAGRILRITTSDGTDWTIMDNGNGSLDITRGTRHNDSLHVMLADTGEIPIDDKKPWRPWVKVW